MNKYAAAIRMLNEGKKPAIDLSKLLNKHNCPYLLKKLSVQNSGTENFLNKIAVTERYKQCSELFNKFKVLNIPYAVIKGAVLSNIAYKNPFTRHSGDIDLIISRQHVDTVKKIMLDDNFVQGRVTVKGVEPFTRKELLFQASMTHQTAPFIKETSNKLCPYVNVDVNLDIMWGESERKADMEYVLRNTVDTELFGIEFKKLCTEMEFISLCLHHYKDMNSIYLLYERGLKLGHYCDIYYYVKNAPISLNKLKTFCDTLGVSQYVYYCLYYTNLIFEDSQLDDYIKAVYSESCNKILHTFGLTDKEKQPWKIDFFTRLFDTNLHEYLKENLDKVLFDKIKTNKSLM